MRSKMCERGYLGLVDPSRSPDRLADYFKAVGVTGRAIEPAAP